MAYAVGTDTASKIIDAINFIKRNNKKRPDEEKIAKFMNSSYGLSLDETINTLRRLVNEGVIYEKQYKNGPSSYVPSDQYIRKRYADEMDQVINQEPSSDDRKEEIGSFCCASTDINKEVGKTDELSNPDSNAKDALSSNDSFLCFLDGLKTPTKDKTNDSSWYDGIYNISSFLKVVQDLVTSNSSLSQLIASERANNTALTKENSKLRTQIQELCAQIGGQTMENMRDLTSLRFVTDGHQIPHFGSRGSGAMGSDIAIMNPLSPISPCVAADNPICQNIGTQAGNVANFQDQLKEVLREKHEIYLLMKSNKCEKSVSNAVDHCEKAVDNASEKSNVIPNSSNISTSREYNNANIVTESILIDHPKGRQKTKRANKKRCRKAIAIEVKASKKTNVSDPQMANDKTCSSPQVTDDKAPDSSGKSNTTNSKANDIMQQQQSIPDSNLKSFGTPPPTSDEMSANPCNAGENPSGNSSNSNKNSAYNTDKTKLGGKDLKRSAVILGDSIVKNIHGWKLKEKCGRNENVYVKCFNGANIKDMHSYAKPR